MRLPPELLMIPHDANVFCLYGEVSEEKMVAQRTFCPIQF